MFIIGCDFHSRFQQIAMLDPTTGEVIERRLEHENRPFDSRCHRRNRAQSCTLSICLCTHRTPRMRATTKSKSKLTNTTSRCTRVLVILWKGPKASASGYQLRVKNLIGLSGSIAAAVFPPPNRPEHTWRHSQQETNRCSRGNACRQSQWGRLAEEERKPTVLSEGPCLLERNKPPSHSQQESLQQPRSRFGISSCTSRCLVE
jgi:hypothetical protein